MITIYRADLTMGKDGNLAKKSGKSEEHNWFKPTDKDSKNDPAKKQF